MESDHQQEFLSRLLTYVPFYWAQRALEHPRTPRATSEWKAGAVLTGELTGLASLTEQAGRLGEEAGREVSRVLNQTLSALLEEALFPFGANMVRLGGDPLVCFFLGELALERAAFAALRMKDVLSRNGPKVGGVQALQLRMGVARGPLYLAQIGDPIDRMEVVLAGPALMNALNAQEEARPGEVCVAAGHSNDAPAVRISTSRGQALLVEAVDPPPPEQPLIDFVSQLGTHTLDKINALRPLVPADLFDRLLENPAASGIQPQLVKATVLLAEVWAIDPALPRSREAFNRRFTMASRTVTRHGGSLSRLDFTPRGRKLTITFGVPESKGNDEERALSCALELREALGSTHLRMAVNTGFLFSGEVGSALKREQAVLGEAVQVASSLLLAAEEGAVVAGPETWRQGGAGFELGPSWLVRLKGFRSPFSARVVIRRNDRIRQSVTPGKLAGRSRELKQALEGLGSVQRRGGGLVVVAHQGMGKTRFLREILAQAPSDLRSRSRRLRCSYLTGERPFSLVEGCVEAITGHRKPIARWIEELPELAESQIKALAAAGFPRDRAAMVDVLVKLGADLISTLGNPKGTLLVIDDLHLGDPESRRVFDLLAQTRTLPFLASSNQSLGAGFREIGLGPLDVTGLQELAEEQVGQPSQTLIRWLEDRSAGSVSRARALLGWLVETEALEKGPDGMQVIAARIEEAPPEVLGQAISGPHPIPPEGQGAVGGTAPVSAESTVPDFDPERLAQKRRLAELIEAVPGARTERVEELASHYADSDRPEKAVHYARLAASQAAERMKLLLALRWTELAARSAQLVDDDVLRREVRLEEGAGWHRIFDCARAATIAREVWREAQANGDDSQAARAAALTCLAAADGGSPEGVEVAREAMLLCDASGDLASRARCRIALAKALRSRGELAEAEFVLEAATDLAGKAEGQELRILALVQSGLVRFERGELHRARAGLEAASMLAREESLQHHRGVILLNLGVLRAAADDRPGAEASFHECEQLAASLGMPVLRAAALVNLADLRLEAGDRGEARRLADLARIDASRSGDLRVVAAAQVTRALACGPDEDAMGLAMDALGRLEPLKDASLFIECAGRLGLMAAERGDYDWAAELLVAARSSAEVTGIERHRSVLDKLALEINREPPPMGSAEGATLRG